MKRAHWMLLLAMTAMVLAGCEACFPPEPKPAPAGPCGPGGKMETNKSYLPYGEDCCPIVSVEKTAPDRVVAGQEYTYTLKVENESDMRLMNVRIIENLPDGFSLASTSPSAQNQGGGVLWTVDSMDPGESKTFTITGAANGAGTLQSCTDVKFDPPAICAVTEVVGPASLEVTKSGPDSAILCDPIEYRIVVKNVGESEACDVVVTDDLPEGLRTLDGETKVTGRAGDLEPGEAKEMSFKVRASGTGTYRNQAVAAAEGGARVQSGVVATEVGTPALVVTKTGPKKRFVNRPITYTIKVCNNGDMDSKNTMLHDNLSNAVQFKSASDGGSLQNGRIAWSLGTIQPGKCKTVQATVIAKKKGDVTSMAVAQAYCAEGSDTAAVAIEGIPALLLECIDTDDPVEVGNKVIYEIRVTNQGSADAANVQVVAKMPDELEFVSASGATKGKHAGNTVTFEPVKSLAANAVATWKVVAKGTKAGDVRFAVELTADQLTKPANETEPTHVYK